MKGDDMEFAKHRSGIKKPRFHISKTVVIATICASLLLLNIYFIHADYSARVTFLKHFSLYKAALAENIKQGIQSSTCSTKASQRGPQQKVIAFSFYGDPNNLRDYFLGIEKNAEVLDKYYPGWIMRVYHDVPEYDAVTTEKLNRMEEQYKDILDTCYVGNLPLYGNMLGLKQMMWRFLTLSDPLVDVSIVRDLDSTFDERETAAVKEWLDSNCTLHVMRDHPSHNTKILGGMWGAKLNSGYRELWNKTSDTLVEAGMNARSKQNDQAFLAKIVWPLAQKETGFVMQHDSYLCENREYSSVGGMRPFPHCRNMKKGPNFVGATRTLNTKPITFICPVPCRPYEQCIHC